MKRAAAVTLALALSNGLAWSRAVTAAAETETQRTRPKNGYWSTGRTRWFLSSKSDLGIVYIKPYLSLGYGLPHWIWAGIDVNTIVTPDVAQFYTGVRASSPVLDLAFGVHDTQSFNKPFLEPARSFTADAVLDDSKPKANFWSWEAEATGIAPLPHSALVLDLILSRNLELPTNLYFYSESYRVVVANPFFVALRAAGVARLLKEDALKLGIFAEYIFETGRDEPVVRIGPVGSLQITDFLEAQAVLTVPVQSPDSLGLIVGSYGILGLRYRWATGAQHMLAPWRGSLIF